MDDTGLHAPSPFMRSQLSDWYPKVWGADQHGGAIYEVFWHTGNGGYSRSYRGTDRAAAVSRFRKFPNGAAFITMRDAVSDELIGEMGRHDYSKEVAVLMRIANSIALDETTVQVVDTRDGKRRLHVNRRALLLKQAAALWAMSHLPGDVV